MIIMLLSHFEYKRVVLVVMCIILIFGTFFTNLTKNKVQVKSPMLASLEMPKVKTAMN